MDTANGNEGTMKRLGWLPGPLARSILDAAPVGVVVTEAAVDEPSPRILYANAAFCEMTGYTPEQVIGRSPRFLQGPDTSRAVLDELRRALVEGRHFEGETWNYRADGSTFLMCWSVDSVTDEDGTSFYFAVQRDVTEVRRLEALAEASNLMENVGYVFGGIRHELGNPVNSIKAALTLLRRGVGQYSIERTVSTLDRVLDELSRVEYLLRDLRSFHAYGEAAPELQPLGPFLERFVKLVGPDCELRGAVVQLSIRDAPELAYFDALGLHQALSNIVHNAVEAIVAGATAQGASGRVTVVARTGRGGTSVIEVDDDGPGMPPDVLEQIFTPFFTTKRERTGLGLALVKRVLAKMGATIEVESQPGAGSAFVIELPRLPPPGP